MTMTSYNATVELTTTADDMTGDLGDAMIERFIDWHPAIGVSDLGRIELVITLPAETFEQAVSATTALTASLNVVRTTVETTDDFDKRSMVEVPELMSVSEVAATLGVTRAAVHKRINARSLPAVRVGSTWAIPAAAVA